MHARLGKTNSTGTRRRARGDGGSGIVILRYEGTTELIESEFDTVSSYNDGGTDYMVHQFTDTGSGQSFTVVPEPGSLALMGLGGLLIGCRRRRD